METVLLTHKIQDHVSIGAVVVKVLNLKLCTFVELIRIIHSIISPTFIEY